jgi:hypothetical protein
MYGIYIHTYDIYVMSQSKADLICRDSIYQNMFHPQSSMTPEFFKIVHLVWSIVSFVLFIISGEKKKLKKRE